MIKSFLCDFSYGLLIADGVLFLLAIGLLVTHFIITNKKKKSSSSKNVQETNVSKVDDDTYLIETEKEEQVSMPEYNNDNNVVHFVNQITNINEELNNELNANTILVNHEVEQHINKPVRKEEIANFVEVAGEKKTKIEEATNANRGSDAFKNATNFFNTIKSEQESDKIGSAKISKRK